MIDIVSTAKQMGIYTIVVDRDANSPAKQFADQAFDISTHCIDDLETICRNNSIDGVFTGFEDFNIHIACQLCSRLGISFYATAEQLQIATNKQLFKAFCKKHSIPVTPQFTLEEALFDAQYPYIIKPADSYGSRGITVCWCADDLKQGYANALASSPCKAAIIESYINSNIGVELFYTIVNGNIHLSATADRYTTTTRGVSVPLPIAEVFPSKHTKQAKHCLDAPIRTMLRDLNIRNGLVLIQSIYDGTSFYVYEMALRLTGEQHYILLAKQQGINLAKFMLDLSLGHDVSQYDTPHLDDTFFIRPSANYVFLLQPGTISQIKGIDQICNMPEVVSAMIVHQPGDTIRDVYDYSRIFARLNVVADSFDALQTAIDMINKKLTVFSDTGNEMLLSHCLPLSS